ncbi:MAG: protein kinase [Gemmatimonadetes bacterium]|nr:protein kinase [Gemmatimonadota bacterium]
MSGDKYCARCGTEVDRSCAMCGTLVLPDDKFCPECGEVSAQPERPQDGAPEAFWSGPIRRLRAGLMGRYRVTHKLGQGGQAAVYLAEEIALHRKVAIKVLAPGSFVSDTAIERFEREARTIASFSHPNIVTVYTVGTVEDLHYFVMQYVEGRSLAAIIGDRGQLPLAVIRAVAYQVGSALQYAHDKKGIIHRDIKPANVLFDEEGNAILTDFGIAKDGSAGARLLTDVAMGTPSYMSPEQCLEKAVTPASDQYSLGVLIYEMLAGRVPFEGSNLEIMNGHTKLPPPPVRGLRPDCPVEMEWAVMRMLEKRPEDRWPSLSEALANLGATTLGRDDPLREEIRRLALEDGPPVESNVTPTGPVRLELRVPERLEMWSRAPLHAFSVVGQVGNPRAIDARWTVDDSRLGVVEGEPPVLEGRAPGRLRLTAASTLGVAHAEVEIVAPPIDAVAVSMARGTLAVGEVVKASADVYDRRGNAIPAAVQWASSDTAVATIDREGNVRAVAAGRALISARAGAASDERMIFVQSTTPFSLAIAAPRKPIRVHDRGVLTAAVFDERGASVEQAVVRWSSSNSVIAGVDEQGVVTGVSPGVVQLTARSGVASATVSLEIVPGPERAESVPPRDGELDDREPVSLGRAKVAVGPPRWSTWQIAALVVVPALLLVVAVWRAKGGGSGNDENGPRERSIPLARAFFSPIVSQSIVNSGYAFNDADLRDDFSSAPGGVGESRGGRLSLRRAPYVLSPKAWTMPSRDFAAHFEFRLEQGDGSRYGGFGFRMGPTERGGVAGYFIFLRIGANPSIGLSYFDGGRYWEVVPSAATRSLRPGDNAVDAVVLGGRLNVFLNGEEALVSPTLTQLAGDQFALFSTRESQYSFDNLVVVGLYRK